MREWKGQAGAPGMASGVAVVLSGRLEAENIPAEDVETELARLKKGREGYIAQLRALAQQAQGDEADILEAYLAIAGDEGFFDEAAALVRGQGLSAASALEQKRAETERAFAALEDEFLRRRGDDVSNVCREVIEAMDAPAAGLLSVAGDGGTPEGQGFVVFAEDLTPVQTLRMDRARLQGFVTERGGMSSHTVILAKSLGIPAVVGAGPLLGEVEAGTAALVDGDSGRVVLSPDAATLTAFEEEKTAAAERGALYAEAAARPGRTRDGAGIGVYANTGDARSAAELDFTVCEGVGLYRTEFLYLGRAEYPGEEAQYVVYRDIARRAAGRPVIIRTLDIGADKQAPYMGLPREENPALGQRGIRQSLADVAVFRTQLRAILRAGAEGDVRVMFPMVAGLEELREALAFLQETEAELVEAGLPCRRRMPAGVMVETPAAVLLAEELAAECDFFSLGTNDLAQYIHAADRMNERVQMLSASCGPALLRAVWAACRAAAKAGIPVGICGEAAAEPLLVPLWAAMGMEEVSVAPALAGRTKYLLGRTDTAAARDVLEDALQCGTAEEVQTRLEELAAEMGVSR